MSETETVERLCEIIKEESDIIDELFLLLMQHISSEQIDAQLLDKMMECTVKENKNTQKRIMRIC